MVVEPVAEQLERKLRSEQQMQLLDVSTNADLPVIAAEADVHLRSEAEVETRALCLIVIATKAEDIPDKVINTMISRYDLTEHFSPLEKTFLSSEESDPEQIVSAQWRYESARTLLWALGVVDQLEPPDQVTNVPAMVRIMASMTSESFRNSASLRPTAEILDAADIAYRYHWTTHNARDKLELSPGGVIESIVYEREYALNWLINYQDQDWDDISSPTEADSGEAAGN
jgi:hypothetical protein